jgi:uncharacterized repeat protein (TIGR03803 family)
MSTQSLSRRVRVLAILAAILTSATSAWSHTLYNFRPFLGGQDPTTDLVSDSQGNLYGMTSGGGTYRAGTIFELKPTSDGSWKREILYEFRGRADGAGPQGGLTFGPDGNLYGPTASGGQHGYGTVFELARQNGEWKETVLFSFSGGTNGYAPGSRLVFDTEGNIYGTTPEGDPCGSGIVFQLTKSKGRWTEQVLFSTCNNDSGYPNSVIVGSDGHLYGTTSFYGPYDGGVAFEIVRHRDNSWTERAIYAFGGGVGDAGRPYGSLIFDAHGNLYGTSSGGGSQCYPTGCGTVFELSPTGVGAWNATVLYSFTGGSDGGNPGGGLVFDTDGNLYGTTSRGGDVKCVIFGYIGCGTVFKLSPGSSSQWTETVLHRFKEDGRGILPFSTPILDSTGNLYATTQGGYNEGVVFEVTQKNGQWQERVLEDFRAGDGGYPSAPPTLAAGGKMFGTTSGDGAYGDVQLGGYGSVFELRPDEHGNMREVVIHNFNGKDGAIPLSSVVLDKSGNLYGTTQRGGTDCGVVFELSQTAGSWHETVLHSFSQSDGCSPEAGLVFDPAGNLYGTTGGGGADGDGLVFELSPGSNGVWSETVLYTFTGGSDGSGPVGGLVFDHAGNLYGTAAYGGSSGCQTNWTTGCGTVYELSPSSSDWTFNVLYTFSGNDGGNPLAALTFDQSNNLYGTTMYGGVSECGSCGTAFELSRSSGGWVESNLYSFDGESDGIYPNSTLVLDKHGNVYGTTPGYKNYPGSLFELTPSSGGWTETTLHDFDNPYNAYPQGGVVLNAAGHLIGTTEAGGTLYAGTVYEFVP